MNYTTIENTCNIISFPDGQQSLVIKDFNLLFLSDFTLTARIRNWSDLELLSCFVSAIGKNSVSGMNLNIVYLCGARSDRRFEDYSPHYMRDVISPVINSFDFKHVNVLDAHSDVTEACVKEYNQLPNPLYDIEELSNEYILVSPDAGAEKKVQKLFETRNNFVSLAYGRKQRDKKGNIVNISVTLPNHELNRFLIVDDLCDGGGTFIGLSKAIKEQKPNAEIELMVTHGIFSKGIEVLEPHFSKIYTTNSYQEQEEHNLLKTIKVI